MCGRVTLAYDPEKIAKRFKATSVAIDEYKRSYNIPPSAKMPIILEADKHRRMESAVWGLKREWASNIINLQAEKLAKGSFKKVLTVRRCILPVDGFFEWGTFGGKKYPVYFKLKTGELFGMPAIYDEGEPKTFAIFTTTPNKIVAPVHHRMPAMLLPEQEDSWLDPKLNDVDAAVAFLRPYPAELMEGYPVSPAVNSPKNDAPELLQQVKGPSR